MWFVPLGTGMYLFVVCTFKVTGSVTNSIPWGHGERRLEGLLGEEGVRTKWKERKGKYVPMWKENVRTQWKERWKM